MTDVKILYITRKYPPMIGGMESMSAALAKEFSQLVSTTLITWGRSQKYLPIFIPFAFIKACFFIPKKGITHIHIGDALLSPLGLLLKILFNVKTSINIAGLDIIFTFPGYQWIIPKCVAKFDLIICISQATREECIQRGIPEQKCVIIPCGIYPKKWESNATKKDLEEIIQANITDKKIFITVGRLVERKGVAWFIQNVFNKLKNNSVYLIIGEGPERERIQELITRFHLEHDVFLLGKILDETLKIIYSTADAFIMPNIQVQGTMEGFGIVAIEASSTGLPVIASDCEGIRDAIISGKTGTLVIPKDRNTYLQLLNHLPITNRQSVKKETIQKYSWDAIGKEYIHQFRKL